MYRCLFLILILNRFSRFYVSMLVVIGFIICKPSFPLRDYFEHNWNMILSQRHTNQGHRQNALLQQKRIFSSQAWIQNVHKWLCNSFSSCTYTYMIQVTVRQSQSKTFVSFIVSSIIVTCNHNSVATGGQTKVL